MITFTEMIIFGNAVTCSILAFVILTRRDVWVQRARNATYITAALSFVCGALGWLLAREWAMAALSRGTLLAIVVGCGCGALWLLRGRLRPRGFQATSRRYARYASYKRVAS